MAPHRRGLPRTIVRWRWKTVGSTQLKDAEPADYDCAEKQVVLVRGFPAGDVLPEIAETVYLFGLLALLVTI